MARNIRNIVTVETKNRLAREKAEAAERERLANAHIEAELKRIVANHVADTTRATRAIEHLKQHSFYAATVDFVKMRRKLGIKAGMSAKYLDCKIPDMQFVITGRVVRFSKTSSLVELECKGHKFFCSPWEIEYAQADPEDDVPNNNLSPNPAQRIQEYSQPSFQRVVVDLGESDMTATSIVAQSIAEFRALYESNDDDEELI